MSINRNFFKPASIQDRHEISDEFEVGQIGSLLSTEQEIISPYTRNREKVVPDTTTLFFYKKKNLIKVADNLSLLITKTAIKIWTSLKFGHNIQFF